MSESKELPSPLAEAIRDVPPALLDRVVDGLHRILWERVFGKERPESELVLPQTEAVEREIRAALANPAAEAGEYENVRREREDFHRRLG